MDSGMFGASMINDLPPQEFLVNRFFQSTDMKTRKEPATFPVKFCFFLLSGLAGVFNCCEFFSPPPNHLLSWSSPWIYQTQSKSHHPLLFFMSSHNIDFTFNLVTWYLEVIWRKFLEISSFQVLMIWIFVLPWVQWPQIWMIPLTP